MSDANSTTKLPSQVVITALLDEFKSFIESGHANYAVVATIDQQRYVIGCDFNHENHINTMRVWSNYCWGRRYVFYKSRMTEFLSFRIIKSN